MENILPPERAVAHTRGCARSWKQLKILVKSDLYRYSGKISAKEFWKHVLFTPGFHYSTLMRLCGYLKISPFKKLGLYHLSKLLLLKARYKYGIAIPEYTEIGPGLFINRFGGIYIHGDVVIGTNCNILPGVMLGAANRGKKAGVPTVGDRVMFANGAKVVGRVHIGDGSVLGVNALVIDDLPPNTVAAAPKALAVSQSGSAAYVNRLFEEAGLPSAFD